MAINKNDYLDGDGNYDLKKDLVDELIDGVNIESGNNSNGSWIKFPDGTMICYSNNRIHRPDGNSRVTNVWTYPQPFIETPSISVTRGAVDDRFDLTDAGYSNTGSTSSQLTYGVENKYSSPLNIYVLLQAIGRWK